MGLLSKVKHSFDALILIDVQKGFHDSYWGGRNNPEAEKHIEVLLECFRSHNIPVIHVQHMSVEVQSPLRPDRPGSEFIPGLGPKNDEKVFQKSVNSAFIGTNLEQYLRQNQLQRLVFVGFTTDHCVSTSTRMAANLGFDATIVADATVAFARQGLKELFPADLVHEVSLASLNKEFAKVLTTKGVQQILSAK
jgi:nicotinamidase-related amidase